MPYTAVRTLSLPGSYCQFRNCMAASGLGLFLEIMVAAYGLALLVITRPLALLKPFGWL